ncbi:microcephalin isoform X1 [Dicentrarchus labrax]|uniref:BRCT domain-containing protein n=1 Tax=Dicentrarchus labrax TaxID=13489 RepID=A0A8P4K8W0_DICLA|nr:microcephalin isoform X1 [Dicentrarchus labrax]XP_051272921.1 microcephalin isoform X1 [Dicentrarchus labrax]XP_051272925.1 microcephalin isoform X1 [Dicentrarchus labrax]XP_051272934.1 microcephalin isoform X1 [Dicentrarchus labrax]
MTTTTSGSVLKDVVAYVDVWSSDKTANYSKPFVQQLQEMGAQVSKTFNKQVTHVVFNNGHPATWRKAKKSGDVRLVSVLWVGRCYDDGVRVDEELYPAIDETNPVLKNKKHRCMQPKDSPERTPENDRRMRKKLDKMMKDLVPKQPLVTDVSPIIIDEENGIVYSPALKRSDYMAQRLKDMKEKRENLSPTASQMVESCSPTRRKPSLGSTPTVLKLMYDQSDDDSSASVAEPAYSPDKEEGRTQCDVIDHGHSEQRHRKGSEKPWLSPCRDVPKRISSPLKCPDIGVKDGNSPKKSRRTSVKKKTAEKHKSLGLLESPRQDRRSDDSKNFSKEKRRSHIKSSSPSPNKSEKGKRKMKAAKSFTEPKTHFFPDAVNSSSCLSSPAKLGDASVELSKKTSSPLQKMEQKIPKRARQSLSTLVRSFTLSCDSKSVASGSTDGGDDNVFEDYFSPANHRQQSKTPLLPNLPVEGDIQIPFEFASVPKKRKPRRSESIGSETNSKKKKKLEESRNQQFDTSSEAPSRPKQDVKESLPALDSPSANITPVPKRRRQSTLPFTSISTTTSKAVKPRRASSSAQSAMFTEANTDVSVLSHTVESRGNECTVAAGLTEIPSEDEDHNKQVSLSLQNMVNETKAMRTLVMTSMPSEKQQTVGQVVKALGGFAIVDRVCESTTHVVSGGHRRTLNILLGIARGCWILSFEWILWCLEQRQWIPEEPYELSDQFPAAQICRLQRHLSAGEHQQDLFQSQPAMFVSQHSQPPTQSLVELIQLCGGTVCKTVRQAGICIGKYSGRRPEGSRILSEQWVLDSITHLKQLSYDNYDLE